LNKFCFSYEFIWIFKYCRANSNLTWISGFQYNTISFNDTKDTPADIDTIEDYTKRKLNNIAYWKHQGDEYFLSVL